MKKDPYECCRCGYKTDDKHAMRKHLFSLVKPCPGSRNTIVLTDTIKNHILDNRVYNVPKPDKSDVNINQTINYNSTVNNYVAGLDALDKLNQYVQYKGISINDFEQSVEDTYYDIVKKLDTSVVTDFQLENDDFLKIIDQVSTKEPSGSIEDFNVVYNPNTNKISIFNNGEWEALLLNQGVTKIITTVQSYYLDSYECYLIKKMNDRNTGAFDQQRYKECLEKYYWFISCFDVNPFVKDKEDRDVFDYGGELGSRKGYDAVERAYNLYKRVVEKKDRVLSRRMYRDVVDVIKKNSSFNIKDINHKIVELVQLEEGFKKTLLEMRGTSNA